MNTLLPVADGRQVRAQAIALLGRRRREFTVTVGLYALGAVAGLLAPRLLGSLVEAVRDGTTTGHINTLALGIGGALLAQVVIIRQASVAAGKLGEGLLAEIREEFVERVLDLPLSTVEAAGSGDLLARSSRDVDALSHAARKGAPTLIVSIVTVTLTLGALALLNPLFLLAPLIVLPIIVFPTRWYLKRAPAGYLRENAAWAQVADDLAETVEGARTIEALRLEEERIRRTDAGIAGSYAAERYTLSLRMRWFPVLDMAFVTPVAVALGLGGWAYLHGWVSLGEVTAATLYLQIMITPLDELLSWLDELQVAGASLARLMGVAEVPADRKASGLLPTDETLTVRDVRYSYVEGREVLHGINLTVRPGERIAVVGPSGAGKSTLGRLLAGIHPPTSGSVEVGGVPLVDLPLDQLRGQVCLVTQEHHMFRGTVRENLQLARPDASDDSVRSSLAAVDALEWVVALPDGLDTVVGDDGAVPLTAPQAQQLALARLVLADPHTLVLDEATSMIDPRAARDLERSLAAVLAGRTVIAIAHRLHTAHDADRVAVVEDGRIAELGSHDELLAAGGSYAALWESWNR